MKRLLALVCCSLVWTSSVLAESVVVTPQPETLAAGGGDLVLSVDIVYGDAPAALGLSIGLPVGWSFVATAGAAKPAIQPGAGSTGLLDFAWLSTPADHATFSIKVKYPAGSGPTSLRGKAILRRDGKALDLPIHVAIGG